MAEKMNFAIDSYCLLCYLQRHIEMVRPLGTEEQTTAFAKRIMQLYPTQKTLDILPSISPILRQWEACLTYDISEEEKALLEKLLSRMKDKASTWMENH